MGSQNGQGGGYGGAGGGQGAGGWGGNFGGGYGGGYDKPAPKVGYGGPMGGQMPMMETGLWRGPRHGSMGGTTDMPPMGGAMGKMGGGIGMPLQGGAMGNAGTGGLPQPGQAGFGEPMSRPLDSYGGWARPQIDGIGGGDGYSLGRPRMPDSGIGGFDPRTGSMGAPPMATTNGPMGAAPAVQPPGVDHNANFAQLYAQNPQMANEYRTRSGDTMSWWQNGGRDQALQGQFGGNQGAMNNWVNSTSGQGGAQNGAITGAQTAQLNNMAGVRPPDWALNAYRQGRSNGQAVNPTYEQFL